MGDLADCRGSSGCVLRRVLLKLMERALSKDCSLFKPSPSMTDGSDGKWKAPQMILDRFLIFF